MLQKSFFCQELNNPRIEALKAVIIFPFLNYIENFISIDLSFEVTGGSWVGSRLLIEITKDNCVRRRQESKNGPRGCRLPFKGVQNLT